MANTVRLFCPAAIHCPGAITAVIFEVDGTLLDSGEAIVQAFQYSFHKNNLASPPRLALMKLAGQSAPTRVKSLLNAMHLRCTREKTGKVTRDAVTALAGGFFVAYGRQMPGALQALSSLHSLGAKLGVVTNSPKKHALIRLKAFGLDRFFNQMLAIEDIAKEKPDPSSLKKILFKLRTPAGNALYVGDSSIDVKYAKSAGGVRVALLSNNHNSKVKADYTLASLTDLADIVTQSHAICQKNN